MKKLFAMILVCVICATTAYAAEWGEGLGPEKPYPGSPEIHLDEEMGGSLFYPSAKMPANYFCDVLEIYLPREDLALGDGHAHLFNGEDEEIADIDFADPTQVELRFQEESELVAKRWGSGMCVEMHLPFSLKFDESYYVTMELNCFNAMDGKVPNYDFDANAVDTEGNHLWIPVLTGDFGISNLYYAAAPAPAEEESEEAEEDEEEAEPTEAPEEEGEVEIKARPEVGDTIHFDLVMGGDAKTAVVFSENDSAYFEVLEFTESTTVTGTVTKPDLDWGVVFLDANDEPIRDAAGYAVTIKPAWAGQYDDAATTGTEEIVEIDG